MEFASENWDSAEKFSPRSSVGLDRCNHLKVDKIPACTASVPQFTLENFQSNIKFYFSDGDKFEIGRDWPIVSLSR